MPCRCAERKKVPAVSTRMRIERMKEYTCNRVVNEVENIFTIKCNSGNWSVNLQDLPPQ